MRVSSGGAAGKGDFQLEKRFASVQGKMFNILKKSVFIFCDYFRILFNNIIWKKSPKIPRKYDITWLLVGAEVNFHYVFSNWS